MKNAETPAPVAPLPPLLDKWAQVALTDGWVQEWLEGAIFPREMVFFLARCEQLGITSIIESGRQDGYSTKIIAEFARRQGTRVYSVDYEADAERARRCRQRLSCYPELNLLQGDAFLLLPKLIKEQDRESVALLVDGPKDFWALALVFACAGYKCVKLAGQHNLNIGAKAREYFESFSPEPVCYEELACETGAHWEELSEKETEFCTEAGAARSLDRSSLGVLRITEQNRFRLRTAHHPNFYFYQPMFSYPAYRLGMPLLTKYLYVLSVKLFA